MALLICRLGLEHLPLREKFDCGNEELNDYIKRYARQNEELHQVAVHHVALDENQQDLLAGYSALAATSIPRGVFHGLANTGRFPYADVPAMLLGRLAVDERFRRRGVGEALLVHALNRALELRQYIGCRYVIVDAYREAVPWYVRYGFALVPGEPSNARTQQMFIDLRTAEKAK